ncbi:MAG: TetR/AcrR family transcriptional regulator [Anaerolineales bacterium]|jgi:AcrR family transcriptional regulator
MCPGQTSSGETTRQAIIEASYQLFTEQGYHGASMRAIAARAGITAGSIYNHFADKERIIQAVILKYHPIMRVLPHLSEVEGASAEELIRDAAHRLAQEVESAPGVLNLVFVELIDLQGKHFSELAQAMYPQVQQFVEKVYASGEIDHSRDPVLFFSSFVGMLLGYAFTRVFLEELPYEPLSDRSLDAYIETFLWGVLSHRKGS